MDNAELAANDNGPLTANGGHFGACGNPLCQAAIQKRKGKKFCSARCRMDAFVMRRAAEMISRVGIVRFTALLERLNDGT